MVMDIGPFRFYRVEHSGTLCVSLKWFDNYPFGWEYGWEDELKGNVTPWVSIRVGKINVFYFEAWKNGFELWFMGFWLII